MRLSMMAVLAAVLGFYGCSDTQVTTAPIEPVIKVGDLTPEILHQDPSLSGKSLRQAKISPNGKMVTVLQGREDDAKQQDLWVYDLSTGEGEILVSSTDLLGEPEVLSDEEKNRRERAREYGKGVVSYSWDEKGEKILFPLGGDVFLYDLVERKAVQVTDTDGFETDARIAKSGKYVSYVRDNELYINSLVSNRERKLSGGATDLIRNGIASFVVQEELARHRGYWLAPDERYMAYTKIDESPVQIEERIEFSANNIENIAQRYPFAGTDNVTVRLGVKTLAGGLTRWVDIGSDPDIYLARVYWSHDGNHLYAGILSRDHKSYKMLDINPDNGASKLMFEETSPTWINVRGSYEALEGGGFLWTSERDGFKHIYRYEADGKNPVQITKGKWPVSRVNCVDEENRNIYFSGWRETPLETHIFRIGFDGGNLMQISEGAGRHGASFAKNCSAYIGTFSNNSTPTQTRAFDANGKPLIWLNENKVHENHPYVPYLASHVTPQFGQLPAGDGTKMDYSLYKPTDILPGERRPAITLVYGGPGAQTVHNGWGRLTAQLLVDNGFIVFQLDNRGAANRGKAFEDHLYRSMGRTEVVDQSVGAEFLKNLRFVDPDRMGVFGWSYGGYMTLHMLAQTDHYKSGVAGAPVTDWSLYDTAYTERYLGDPRPDNVNYTKGAYEEGAVFPHIEGLTEPFLLMHGMADDNVVFRHSIKLMDVMQKKGAHNMRLMTYPGEKHGFRKKENQIHRDHQILNFFNETLKE